MKHAFEVYAPSGTELREFAISDSREQRLHELKQEFDSAEWCRIRYHKCRNEKQQPCDQWTVEHEHGDVPDPEEEE